MFKLISYWFEGWLCSFCQTENPDKADNCTKCLKPYHECDEWISEDKTYEAVATWGICGDCQGDGTTYLGWAAKDQPAFTAEDFYEEGPDFRDDYMSGAYDRDCPACDGSGKVKEVDLSKVPPDILEAYQDDLRAKYEYEAECRVERAFGC